MNAPDDDAAAAKAAARTAWNTPGAGYQEIAEGLRPAVEHLLDFANVGAGQRLLDVATGTGVTAIAAARRGAEVVGVDFAPDLLAEARRLAAAAELSERVEFVEGDAEALPFPDAAFDAVVSSFGSIFAPRHDVVAAEMARVLRPSGTLALATWQPEGPNLRLMTLLVPFMPTPPSAGPGPLSWGRRDYVEQQFGAYCKDFECAEGNAPWLATSPSDAVELLYQRSLGPTVAIFNSLDVRTQLAAHNATIALLRDNLTSDGSVNMARSYLLVKATRR